jgi:hypothetical protein
MNQRKDLDGVEECEMGVAYGTHGRKRNACRVVGEEL